MVNMESSPLLLVPEEEESLERPIYVENQFARSLSCFGCCFGQREDDGGEKWWMQSGLSQSIKRAKEFSESVIVEAGNYYVCGGKTWKTVVHRLRNKKNGRNQKRGQRFQYDMPSYELNFDDGSREEMGLP